MVYKPIKLNITKNQLLKVKNGKPIRLTANQIGTGQEVHLHPVQHKIIQRAFKAKRGCGLHLAPGEILSTKEAGSGIFDSIWNGLKSGNNWVKNNWGVVKPVLSAVGDAVATAIPEAAPLRGLVKSVSGVGLTQSKRVFTQDQVNELKNRPAPTNYNRKSLQKYSEALPKPKKKNL